MTRFPTALLAATLLTLGAAPAHALFKVVAPDGSVTYTDRPPAASEGRVQAVSGDTGRASDVQLPYALRQVAARFPVVLFTASTCGEACALAKAHLARRGIPYSERTAVTDDERDAWSRIVGGTEAPTLLVGSQSLRGFVPAQWDETLSVAGYPATSQLPANWQPPPPVPLVPPRAAPSTPTLPTLPTLPAAPPALGSDNPAGVRF
jgi:hypothetical protein